MSPMTPAVVSAPGKLILMGEHAAVYGHPAVVSAIDLRLTASVRPGDGDDGEGLIRVAVEESRRRLGLGSAPFSLSLASELPPGAGFGSSAALGIGIAGALQCASSGALDRDVLREISMAVERHQHGNPSGIDTEAVLLGGVIWAERQQERLVSSPCTLGNALLKQIRVFDSGVPAEGTGEVVAEVRRRIEADRELEGAMTAIDRCTHALRELLAEEDAGVETMGVLFQGAEMALETLGVVPDEVRGAIREIETQGGAAKISGAGALTGTAAGSVLVVHPQAERVVPRHWRRVDLRLGAEGVRREAG